MQPSVTMVALYADRPQFIERAISSFRSQTYGRKWLLLYDNGREPFKGILYKNEILVREHTGSARTIGELRNAANVLSRTEVIAHADIDDWSHPNRIAEQVALLQASQKECVGYRDMLFWRTPSNGVCECGALSAYECAEGGDTPEERERCRMGKGEAWLYTNAQPSYCLGTSFCYWRSVWERRPFEALPKGPMGMGEDHHWLSGVDSMGVGSLIQPAGPAKWQSIQGYDWGNSSKAMEPRMIASVHGGNSTDIMKVAIQVKDKMLRRAPEFDSYCRERMALGSSVASKFTEEPAL